MLIAQYFSEYGRWKVDADNNPTISRVTAQQFEGVVMTRLEQALDSFQWLGHKIFIFLLSDKGSLCLSCKK
jgi:hypothetical protein